MRDFKGLLQQQWESGRFVCVGLDIDIARLPTGFESGSVYDRLTGFASEVVDATADYAAAYKPNIAYFERYGADGLSALREIVLDIQRRYPEKVVIVDAKRADIASTNDGYVEALFEYLNADATTLHPYLGEEALRPFLDLPNKGLFILCRTSNSGAGELQDRETSGEPLYRSLARSVASRWASNSTLGLVVGATYPKELESVRRVAPHTPILVPGVGAQGGDLEASVAAGGDEQRQGFLINSSRGILYASSGSDYREAAAAAAADLHAQITEARAEEEGR